MEQVFLFIFYAVSFGLGVSLIPIVVIIEIYHWVTDEQRISYPFLKAAPLGVVVGIIVTHLTIKTASGEAGWGAVIIAPFLFSGCVSAGILAGVFYKVRRKPLLTIFYGKLSFSHRLFVFVSIVTISFLVRLLVFAWSGIVVDKETGKPIEGAAIARSWDRKSIVDTALEGFKETSSSKDGGFWLAGKTFSFSIPFLSVVTDSKMPVYRAGYKFLLLDKKKSKIEMERVPTSVEARKKELEAVRYNYKIEEFYRGYHKPKIFRQVAEKEQEFIDSAKLLKGEIKKEIKEASKKSAASIDKPKETMRQVRPGLWVGTNVVGVTVTPAMRKKMKEIRRKQQRFADSFTLDDLAEIVRNKQYEDRCRTAAFFVARKDPETLPYFIEALKDSDFCMKKVAIRALEGLKDPRTIEPLIGALADKAIASRARKALSKKGEPVVELLINALENADENIQQEAAYTLRSIRDPRAIEPLIALVKLEKEGVSPAAVIALGAFEDPRVTEVLLEALEHGNPKIRDAARAALYPRVPDVLDILIEKLKSENPRVRRDVARLLGRMLLFGKIKDFRAVNPLILGLQDEDAEVRKIAAWGLSGTSDARAVEAIFSLWKDENSEVRSRAAESLVNVGDSAIELLISALNREDPYLRWRAAWCLGRIKNPRTVEPLIAALNDKAPEVKWMATAAVGGIGDPRAIEYLIKMSEDADPGIKEIATLSLTKIRGENMLRGE